MTTYIKQVTLITILVSMLFTTGGILPYSAQAATCANTSVELVFRQPNTSLAENVRWALYKQERTVDARRYLGRAVTGGTTNESGSIRFDINPYAVVSESKRGGSIDFAVKVWQLNGNVGEEIFWDVRIPCGRVIQESFTLSTLTVTIRDEQGSIVTNYPYVIYTQKNAPDGSPIIDKPVAATNTGISGYGTTFLGSGAYIIRIPAPSNRNSNYEAKNVIVRPGVANTFDYRTGNLRIAISDGSGKRLPNVNVDLYTQKQTLDGPALDRRIATGRTDVNGTVTYFQPEGTYAMRVYGPLGSIYDFYSVSIKRESNSEISKSLSTALLTTRDQNGSLVGGVHASLSEQLVNADGELVLGRHIQTIRTDVTGAGTFYVSPGTYVLAVGNERKYNIVVHEGVSTNISYRAPYSAPAAGTTAQAKPIVKGVVFTAIPNGSVVKSNASNKVYFIEKGTKRAVPNEATFFAYGFNWTQVHIIKNAELEAYPEGFPLSELPKSSIPNGSLVKTDQSTAVYFIEDGKKRVFVDGYSFEVLGFKYKNIQYVSQFVLDQYPSGDAIRVPVGLATGLVKAENVSTIYRIENGLKRPYVTEAAFLAEGNDWDEVRVVPFEEIRSIPNGAEIR